MRSRLALAGSLGMTLLACGSPNATPAADTAAVITGPATRAPADWRRGATCYEVFVRSFYDSDGDGIGDLRVGGPAGASLSVTADGRARDYVLLGTIGPIESHVFALTRAQ